MRYLRRTLLPFVLVLGMMAGEGIGVLAQAGDGATIRVGSLSFTESTILGEMISQLLEEDGYTVERKPDLGGTAEAHQALVSGEVDLYVEYTGGALVSILGLPVPTAGTPDAATPAVSIDDQVLITVAENYLDQFSLVWLDEFGFNDTYALAVTAETAKKYDLVTVSDLAAHAGEMTLGTDEEFPDRADGLPGLKATYGIEFGEVKPGATGLMYENIASGAVDVITAYTTDGRLPGLDLVLLEDDKHFFPPYFAAPVVRQELLANNPGLEEVINQLAGKIDNETMANLNYQVDVEGKLPVDVARAFLVGLGLVGSHIAL